MLASLLGSCMLLASPLQSYAAVGTGGPGVSEAAESGAQGDASAQAAVASDGSVSMGTSAPAAASSLPRTMQTIAPVASTDQIKAAAAQIAVPEINSGTAVVIDAATGTVIYGKSEDTPFYPASITKLMTALLVYEHCNLDEQVTFSHAAVSDLESGAVTAGVSEGDVLTVRDCLYALLLKSANEVANGLAEHVSGSVSAFAQLMNERAKGLGCTNTNFCNPNGLTNSSHVVSAKDMALIARAAFSYPELVAIDTTPSYTLPATQKYPNGLTVSLKHKMLATGTDYHYQYAIAGKTGYTSAAGNTLVTAAEKDGVRLIAVVMKAKSGQHYAETKLLFEYGWKVMDAARTAGGATVTTGVGAGGPTSETTGADAGGPAGETAGANAGGSASETTGAANDAAAETGADGVTAAAVSAGTATGTDTTASQTTASTDADISGTAPTMSAQPEVSGQVVSGPNAQ